MTFETGHLYHIKGMVKIEGWELVCQFTNIEMDLSSRTFVFKRLAQNFSKRWGFQAHPQSEIQIWETDLRLYDIVEVSISELPLFVSFDLIMEPFDRLLKEHA